MKQGLLLLVGLILMSCNGAADKPPVATEEPVPDAVAALTWVETADPDKDAEAAIANGDYRLWVMAGRGERAPGLTSDQQFFKTRCGIRYLPGSTDLVVNQRHMQLMGTLEDYAAAYNQKMLPYCQP